MNNKINALFKFKFLFKQSTTIVVIGEEKEESKQVINQILSAFPKTEKDFLV